MTRVSRSVLILAGLSLQSVAEYMVSNFAKAADFWSVYKKQGDMKKNIYGGDRDSHDSLWQCMHKASKQVRVCKTSSKKPLKNQGYSNSENERIATDKIIESTAKMDHPNIARLIELNESSEEFILVSEIGSVGNLKEVFMGDAKKTLTEAQIMSLLSDMLSALSYVKGKHGRCLGYGLPNLETVSLLEFDVMTPAGVKTPAGTVKRYSAKIHMDSDPFATSSKPIPYEDPRVHTEHAQELQNYYFSCQSNVLAVGAMAVQMLGVSGTKGFEEIESSSRQNFEIESMIKNLRGHGDKHSEFKRVEQELKRILNGLRDKISSDAFNFVSTLLEIRVSRGHYAQAALEALFKLRSVSDDTVSKSLAPPRSEPDDPDSNSAVEFKTDPNSSVNSVAESRRNPEPNDYSITLNIEEIKEQLIQDLKTHDLKEGITMNPTETSTSGSEYRYEMSWIQNAALFLTAQEISDEALGYEVRAVFQHLDTNFDGLLDQGEFQEFVAPVDSDKSDTGFFKFVDFNQDEHIEWTEFTRVFAVTKSIERMTPKKKTRLVNSMFSFLAQLSQSEFQLGKLTRVVELESSSKEQTQSMNLKKLQKNFCLRNGRCFDTEGFYSVDAPAETADTLTNEIFSGIFSVPFNLENVDSASDESSELEPQESQEEDAEEEVSKPAAPSTLSEIVNRFYGQSDSVSSGNAYLDTMSRRLSYKLDILSWAEKGKEETVLDCEKRSDKSQRKYKCKRIKVLKGDIDKKKKYIEDEIQRLKVHEVFTDEESSLTGSYEIIYLVYEAPTTAVAQPKITQDRPAVTQSEPFDEEIMSNRYDRGAKLPREYETNAAFWECTKTDDVTRELRMCKEITLLEIYDGVDDRGNQEDNGGRSEESIQEEIGMMRKMDHANIAKLIEEIKTQKYYYLISERGPSGDLERAFSTEGRKTFKFTETGIKFLLSDIFSAVSYMHSENVHHGGLRMENVLLLDSDGTVPEKKYTAKVTDFRKAKLITNDSEARNDTLDDMRRVGIMAVRMLGKPDYNLPYQTNYEAFFLDNNRHTVEEKRDKVKELLTGSDQLQDHEGAVDFVLRLLQLEEPRIDNADDALKDPWLNGYAAVGPHLPFSSTTTTASSVQPNTTDSSGLGDKGDVNDIRIEAVQIAPTPTMSATSSTWLGSVTGVIDAWKVISLSSKVVGQTRTLEQSQTVAPYGFEAFKALYVAVNPGETFEQFLLRKRPQQADPKKIFVWDPLHEDLRQLLEKARYENHAALSTFLNSSLSTSRPHVQFSRGLKEKVQDFCRVGWNPSGRANRVGQLISSWSQDPDLRRINSVEIGESLHLDFLTLTKSRSVEEVGKLMRKYATQLNEAVKPRGPRGFLKTAPNYFTMEVLVFSDAFQLILKKKMRVNV